MQLIDIKDEIIRKLKNAFPTFTIYSEEVKQGIKKPAFFVEIIPVSINNYQYYKTKNLLIKVTYISLQESNAENYAMIDSLADVFGLTLKVKDRNFSVLSLSPVIIDEVLQFGFSLTFNESVNWIEITDDFGEVKYILPDESKGYTQDRTKIMRNLDITGGN